MTKMPQVVVIGGASRHPEKSRRPADAEYDPPRFKAAGWRNYEALMMALNRV